MSPDDVKDIPSGSLVRLTVEGRLQKRVEYGVTLEHPQNPKRWYTFMEVDGEMRALALMTTAIEVLPEPVTEPTGDYAILQDRNGHVWVLLPAGRAYKRHWSSVGPGGSYTWSQLVDHVGPLVVISEGVPA